MAKARLELGGVLDELEALHGKLPRPIPRTPFAWVLWENVAYLVSEERRTEIFRALEQRTKLDPLRIANLDDEEIEDLVRTGGMRPVDRARKVRTCAEIALELGGGDLTRILDLPPARACTALKRFPGIGVPGADWILLACGGEPRPALDSNGLRVLQRLGLAPAMGAYAAQYRDAVAVLAEAIPERATARIRARRLLQAHGRGPCRNKAPLCGECPLEARCLHAARGA